ncbi:MAG: glycosyltransferase family 39 protein [Sphingobium sp.]
MYRQTALAGPGLRPWSATAFFLCAAPVLWFILTALATPFDHDESQYIAGAHFSAKMLMFRDFLSLQPPLHGWVMAPVAWAFPSHTVLALRLATAATAVATLGLMWSAQRKAGISRDSAALATLLIAATATFQFAAGVVRNDMLPALLSAGAIHMLLQAMRTCHSRDRIVAGVLFGLAVAAKISFAPLAVAAWMFTLTAGGRCGPRAAWQLGLGGAIGGAPLVLAWLIAPESFVYGVITFAMTGPFAWYMANGAGHELTMIEKSADLLRFLWKGPGLVALILIGWQYRARRYRAGQHRPLSAERRLALWLVIGGGIGAILPTPSHVQYLMPLLPPLALALGHCLDDARHWRTSARQMLLALFSLACLPGVMEATLNLSAMARAGSPVVEATADARWAGAMARGKVDGDIIIATLAPHRIIDSGLPLDPRFAAGPFAYRTGWTITPAKARRINAITPQTLGELDKAPPAGILVGYENGTRKLPLAPDRELAAYARRRGYQPVEMPDGVGQLYLRVRKDADRRRPR